MKRIALLANHNNGYQITQYLHKRKDVIIVLLVVYPEPKGAWWKSVLQYAKEHNIPHWEFTNTKDMYSMLKKEQFDMLISANWRHLLPGNILRLAPLGAVNFHNSLLPALRGAYANAWAIQTGLDKTGVSLHWMSEEFDTGNIIAHEVVPIYPTDTARELWRRINKYFLIMFKKAWPRVDEWHKISRKQKGKASYYSKKDYDATNEIRLSARATYKDVINFLRARTFSPEYKGAYFIDPKTNKRVYVTVSLSTDE